MKDKNRREVSLCLRPSIYRKIRREAIALDCTVTSLVAEALSEWLKWIRKAELFERKYDEDVKNQIRQIQKEIEQELAGRMRSK
jgi:hypothetical protein